MMKAMTAVTACAGSSRLTEAEYLVMERDSVIKHDELPSIVLPSIAVSRA